MKTIATLLFTALCIAAGNTQAHDKGTHVYYCKHKRDCPVPPVPPAPPAPPAAPAAPAAPMSTLPSLPDLPAPPAPPLPPKMPDVPKAAHAACAGKKDGAALTFTVGKGKIMAGYCERENGKMVFQLESYYSES